MNAFTPRSFDCPELVLEPQKEASLLQSIENAANNRQKQLLVIDIKRSLLSIRHKMSVIMYQTALICKANARDFQLFEAFAEKNLSPLDPSSIGYKGCLYNIKDFYHYRLMIGNFVETFAAATFSLFDVCGRLLNDLYDLGKPAEKTTFKVAYKDLQKTKSTNPDPVFTMISMYYLPGNDPQIPSWLEPLEQIRHQTTHRPITDICYVDSKSNFYPEISPTETNFFLQARLFLPGSNKVRLCDFVEEVFQGVQTFIETLYDLLRQAVDQQGSLPLS